MEIAKAEESLKAAELCYAQGLYNSSANRAYYAMFQAAQVALVQVPIKGGVEIMRPWPLGFHTWPSL